MRPPSRRRPVAMDERTRALRETGRRKVRRETLCPAMSRSRFRTRAAQLWFFERVSAPTEASLLGTPAMASVHALTP